MKRSGSNLSYDRQVHILSSLTGIADDRAALEAALERQGFTAFRAWQTFIAKFCQPSELGDHRAYQIEEAKVWIASPDGFPGHLTGTERGYRSSIIAELRRKRDLENAVRYQDIPADEAWKQYIDPCVRCLEREQILRPDYVRKMREDLSEDFRQRRAQEVRLHGGRGQGGEAPADYKLAFEESLETALSPLGFARDEFRSSEFMPVYSKKINELWALCWSPESERTFALLERTGRKGEELKIELNLCLYASTKARRRAIVIPVGFQSSSVLRIRHDRIVPMFAGYYQYFSDIRELRTIVEAQLSLFTLIANPVEAAIARGLQENPS